MWSDRRSLMLSKVCTVIFMAVLAVFLVGAPWFVEGLLTYSINANREHYALFLVSMYTGGALAAVLLVNLYRLLHNIGKEQVFTRQNVKLLRGISWLCIAGGLVCTASALYYFPWLIAGAAAAFIGLIVRVVKNIIAQAIALKEENDFTI